MINNYLKTRNHNTNYTSIAVFRLTTCFSSRFGFRAVRQESNPQSATVYRSVR
jgi:hypothetical protein